MMLSPADDYLIHQTPKPLRYVYTSDRRFYDRYFFFGVSTDGRLGLLLGMGQYPNLGVIDAFASFSFASTVRTVRGSRELTDDRLDTANVGPISLKVVEGLKCFEFACDDTAGIKFELTWTGSHPPLLEPETLEQFEGRTVEHTTRIIQSGHWRGSINIGSEVFSFDDGSFVGGRDHSWGYRASGLEPDPPGKYESVKKGQEVGVWIWSPMQFADHGLHFNVKESSDGERQLSTVKQTSNATAEELLLGGAEHDLSFDAGTHQLRGGSLSYLDSDNRRRSITIRPLRSCYLLAGLGYGGPDGWRHGTYMGSQWSSAVSYDLSDDDVMRQLGWVEHAMCELELDSGELGYSNIEVVVSPRSRYGRDLNWSGWGGLDI